MDTSIVPPSRSRGILSDIRFFFLHKPAVPTLIESDSEEERENYSRRIMQRLGTSVADYSILNIHKIGINAPVKYVFEELLKWDGDSTCWPNHIAAVQRIHGRLERIRIFLFGIKKSSLTLLFNLNAIKIQRLPDPADFDNARYLLYKCSGGYPIGIFSMYARSSITVLNEEEQTQLF
ncbi:MAG: hypothetical protein GY950_01085, partial [bacterium]|nr:hypothetical protein [bacterium]